MQKRLVRRVDALEAGRGAPGDANGALQALEARIDRVEDKYKAQIESLRGQVLALSGQVKRLKGEG